MKASKTLIGGFIMGAVALAVAAVLLFGGGRFFEDNPRYVLFFDGSVKGLNAGAPVLLNGVKIGSVADVQVELNLDDLTCRTPVIIEVYQDVNILGETKAIEAAARDAGGDLNLYRRMVLDRLVDRGLRAQLRIQSLVTGQLAVEFGFKPGTPVKLAGRSAYHELPTVPSELERLLRTIEEFPLEETVFKVKDLLENLNRLVGSQEARDTAASISQISKDLAQLSRKWNDRTDELARRLDEVLGDIHRLAVKVDGRIEPLAARVEEALKGSGEVLAEAKSALATLDRELGAESGSLRELRASLRAAAGAMDSFRALVDYLEQHPEALIKGKRVE